MVTGMRSALQRDFEGQIRTPVLVGTDTQNATQCGDALLDFYQAESRTTFARISLRGHADPIVTDRADEHLTVLVQIDFRPARASVLGDVGKGLLSDSVDRSLDCGGDIGLER